MRQLFNRAANGILGSLSLPFVLTPYFLLCLFWKVCVCAHYERSKNSIKVLLISQRRHCFRHEVLETGFLRNRVFTNGVFEMAYYAVLNLNGV
jgi:hypothetical protein